MAFAINGNNLPPTTNNDTPSLAESISDLNANFSKSNEATLDALAELNSSLTQLVAAQRNETDQGDVNINIDRTTVRLDGVEVYAVVSALTIATSIACFDAFSCHDWEELVQVGNYVELIGDVIFLVASSVGIVSGIHATLVFSLMTMYGRTAVGLDRDDAFASFFQSTAAERYRGFRTFLYSMYAFLIQITVLVTSKCPEKSRVAVFVATLYAIYIVYDDTQAIIEKAGIIFVPPKNPRNRKRMSY